MTDTLKNSVEEVFAEHQPKLKGFIRKRVDNKDDADDILQEVFYRLIKVNNSLNPIENISGWLYKVAKNLIINQNSKKKEEELPSYKDDDEDILNEFSEILFNKNLSAPPTPETEYLRSLVWIELEEALSELPAEQRKIFELTELEDIPVKEISKQTGVSVNTLLSRKHYAVLHLRKRLAELYEDIITA